MGNPKKKIVIAGANGFIGSFLLKNLKNDYNITSIVRKKRLIDNNYVQLDLRDKIGVETFVEGTPRFDVLIFLVGLAHKKGQGKDIDSFRQINKQTLVNLTYAFDKKNKLPSKIIFASTISVYGERINRKFYYEDSDKEPFSPYAVTKLEAEEFLSKHYASRSWILRFAPVYSPDFQLNIKRRTKVKSFYYQVGDGANKLSLCNLENIGVVTRGILDNVIPVGPFNISDKNIYTFNDLLSHIDAKRIINVPKFLIKFLGYIGKMMNIIFIQENSIKLVSDNIYPCDKVIKYVQLPSVLSDHKKNVKQIL